MRIHKRSYRRDEEDAEKYKWTWILLGLALIMAMYLMWGTVFASKEKLPEIREIQSFSMENVDGSTVSLEDTQGKVRLFYFISPVVRMSARLRRLRYPRCRIC